MNRHVRNPYVECNLSNVSAFPLWRGYRYLSQTFFNLLNTVKSLYFSRTFSTKAMSTSQAEAVTEKQLFLSAATTMPRRTRHLQVALELQTDEPHCHKDKEEHMKEEQLNELLYQALETELGGVQVYTTALRCAVNDDLKEEWEKYLDQTRNHVQIVQDTLATLDLDPEKETPGRQVVRHTGESLVKAMEMALESGEPEAAQLVAAECVVLAETKDHLNWELIGEAAKKTTGETAKALKAAHDQVENEEDEHLYHTTGWTRELWIKSLGMKAVLPPPEEEKDVKTAIGAARAKHARADML
jgi:rubrerythrin